MITLGDFFLRLLKADIQISHPTEKLTIGRWHVSIAGRTINIGSEFILGDVGRFLSPDHEFDAGDSGSGIGS